MKNLLAVAKQAATKRDADNAYAEIRQVEADTLLDLGWKALRVFQNNTHRSGDAFEVHVQYPGVVIKSRYDQAEYRLRVRYERADDHIDIAAEKAVGHFSGNPTVDRPRAGTSTERLEEACTTLARWIGENLK